YIRRSLEQWFHVFHVTSAHFGQQDLLLGCGVFQAENLADDRPRTPTGRALWEAGREELFPQRRGTARRDGEDARGAAARHRSVRRRGTARRGGACARSRRIQLQLHVFLHAGRHASEADASATETLVASGYSRAKKVSERDQCSKRRRGDLHRVTPPARTRAVERPVFEEEARRGAPRL